MPQGTLPGGQEEGGGARSHDRPVLAMINPLQGLRAKQQTRAVQQPTFFLSVYVGTGEDWVTFSR